MHKGRLPAEMLFSTIIVIINNNTITYNYITKDTAFELDDSTLQENINIVSKRDQMTTAK